MVDEETVLGVAKLAHLKIEKQKIPGLMKDFANILEDFKDLRKVETAGIEPMISPLSESPEFREDVVIQEASVEDVLSNAPERKGALFKVPPVV